MSRLHTALQGTAEPAPRLEHLPHRLTEQDLDRARQAVESFHRTVDEARADAERAAYRSGWRWGLLDGFVLGALTIAIALLIGINLKWVPW